MPEWLKAGDIVYFQRLLVNEHGGLHSIRDDGALESTLARPQQLLHCDPKASIYELAASYGRTVNPSPLLTGSNIKLI